MLDPLPRRRPLDTAAVYTHSRTRTSSSGTYPLPIQSPTPLHLAQPGQGMHHSRRSPSVNTFSTASSIPPPAAFRTSPTADLRRSTSSRSGGASPQPMSYVAALRRQKGTVWCDRSQTEDPSFIAQQRAAKMKATMEVVGSQRYVSGGYGSSGGRTSTGISATGKVAAKIKHHGKPGVKGYIPGENHVGIGGVPMRLSATEVEGESTDDDDGFNTRTQALHHRRTGSSGRSSTASGRKGVGYRSSGGLGSQREKRWSPGDTPERTGSLAEEALEHVEGVADDAASGKARSTGSGSSGERADNVGELGSAARLASNSLLNAAVKREKSVKNVEELKRRGSVDERSMSLSTGRLYIANPD